MENDILLAIHQIWRTFLAKGTTVICRHIYSHQDSRKRNTPAVLSDIPDPGSDGSTSHTSYSDQSDSDGSSPPHRPRTLDTPTLINIACDRLATDTSSAALQGATNKSMPGTIRYPLPGSKAQIRIGTLGSHLTSGGISSGNEERIFSAVTASRNTTG